MIAIVKEDAFVYKTMIEPYIGLEIEIIELCETESIVLLTGQPRSIYGREYVSIIEE